MKPKTRSTEQDDLLRVRARLIEMIDMRHELVKLAALIDWDIFEREWAGFFPSHTGRPATSPRLVAGLLYLQHAFALSDEAVVARWAENPYWQHFCGETFFQHRLPIDPSSMTRWRKRIGEEGVEWMLTQTIESGKRAGAVKGNDLKRVTVDTTVMEKNIAHPTDARLYETARRKLVGLAREAGIGLRQNYNRLAPRLPGQVGRYAHARQFKRMRKALRRLKGYTGRVLRDVERQLDQIPEGVLKARIVEIIALVNRLLAQEPKDKNKLYSLHIEGQGAQAIRIRNQGQRGHGQPGWLCGRDAGASRQSLRRSYTQRGAGTGRNPDRPKAGVRFRRPWIPWPWRAECKGLHQRCQAWRNPDHRQALTTAKCYRADDRAHEKRWPTDAKHLERDRGRHRLRRALRLRPQHPHDPQVPEDHFAPADLADPPCLHDR